MDSFEPGLWTTTSFTRTTDGFLQGRAVVTSVGVFTYRHQDGSVTQELLLPGDVFATDSFASMKLKPVTNNHPTEKVTPDNTQELAVGSLGSNPSSTAQEYDWNGKYTPLEKLTESTKANTYKTYIDAGILEPYEARFLEFGDTLDKIPVPEDLLPPVETVEPPPPQGEDNIEPPAGEDTNAEENQEDDEGAAVGEDDKNTPPKKAAKDKPKK